jgi:hypothetical protein
LAGFAIVNRITPTLQYSSTPALRLCLITDLLITDYSFPMRSDEIERRKAVEAGGSVVASVRKTKGVRADEGLITWAEKAGCYLYIGDAVRHTPYRRSPWYNPAKHRQTDHDRAVEEYKDYILKKPDLLKRLPELRGKVLGCWCYPKSCHGNILIELCYKRRPNR